MFKIKYYLKYEFINEDNILCTGWDIITLPFLGNIESLVLDYLMRVEANIGVPVEEICISQLSKLN